MTNTTQKAPRQTKARSGGRPSLVESVRDKIITAVRIGVSLDAACGYSGVSPRTLERWRRIARECETKKESQLTKHENDCVTFCRALDIALDEFEVRAQTTVGMIASQPDLLSMPIEEKRLALQAAQWWLSHRKTAKYNTQQRVEVTGANGGPVEIEGGENILQIMKDLVAANPPEYEDE